MSDKLLIKRLGQIIQRLRKEKGLSQEDFAHQCGVHRTYIGVIERGEKSMSIVTTAKIAKALDLTLSQLLAELEKES